MFALIQSFFINKEKSFTPLQTIVIVSYNKTNYINLDYSSFNHTNLIFNTENIIWTLNN